MPAAAALDAKAETGKPDFPWTVRVMEDRGHNRLNDCLVCVPCDGFVHDNIYQLMTCEVVGMNVTTKGICIITGPEAGQCRLLAHSRRSAAAEVRSVYRRIADVRG